ncbi:MAG: hypothetical protein ABJH05_04730 [Fulvivirga sp.]
MKHNVEIIPDGLARVLIMIILAPIIVYFEWFFMAFFLLYLMTTAMAGYDPIKAFISDLISNKGVESADK